jgi:hypothetical protein
MTEMFESFVLFAIKVKDHLSIDKKLTNFLAINYYGQEPKCPSTDQRACEEQQFVARSWLGPQTLLCIYGDLWKAHLRGNFLRGHEPVMPGQKPVVLISNDRD